jgi:hypothetical protein
MTADLRTQLQGALGTGYTLDRELGGGGMSRVFLATDVRLGRQVVIKVLSPDLVSSVSAERFEREIRLAARLQHPHIVPLLSAGDVSGIPFYTMPFVEGASLRERLNAGAMPLAEAQSILRDVARALGYAHRQGIVHRDIKPENVLLAEGVAMVADFGVARALTAATTLPGDMLTQVGMQIGTPAYMAPEQLLGGPVDARADIYAFGVVLSEMLTGRHPLQAASPGHRSLDEPAAPVSSSMTTVITRCVQTDPAARYASAQELLDALKRGGPDRSPLYDADAGAGAQARRTDARWWWEFHQLAAAVVYCAMVYPAWLGRGVLGGLPGRALFILTLAAVIVSVTLRAHLWFTARSYGDHLDWARQRNGPWVLAADGIFALTLISGGLAIGDSPLGITLLSVGIGAAAAALVVEPVTTRAAFKELTN